MTTGPGPSTRQALLRLLNALNDAYDSGTGVVLLHVTTGEAMALGMEIEGVLEEYTEDGPEPWKGDEDGEAPPP